MVLDINSTYGEYCEEFSSGENVHHYRWGVWKWNWKLFEVIIHFLNVVFFSGIHFRVHEKELIHIILPLSGRSATFQNFMDKFFRIALTHDRRVHLTVVYFGNEGLQEARAIMSRVLGAKNGGNSSNLKLLALNETFSRGELFRLYFK